MSSSLTVPINIRIPASLNEKLKAAAAADRSAAPGATTTKGEIIRMILTKHFLDAEDAVQPVAN